MIQAGYEGGNRCRKKYLTCIMFFSAISLPSYHKFSGATTSGMLIFILKNVFITQVCSKLFDVRSKKHAFIECAF